MARLSLIVTIIVVALACVYAEKEFYSSRYDDVNIQEILENEKLRAQYYNCFLGTAPCKTADAKFFAGVIGEAMQTQCRKCTEKQKNLLDTLVDWYTKNRPEEWEAFVKKTIENAQNKNA
ncbi:PREDICTED: ejaculatory bulb-specific protein 3-like [Trachymyrmex cornetzi]|uniref:Putative odorant-binding protein A10 n=1 Tax=Trachymyrmex cornetzi TaxID=471704 RepID=A0A151JN55_9HYME|nr:PREDICTED: ejaculatory bulb-specific protein 3-like [Trachymyrmex cornetzi]KYN27880.1 Putative odorant-binding protein A10 [Trachymyrmex cornetzi]